MTESYKSNKRQGIKIPRISLCPPYITANPYFVEYVDAIDEVYATSVDSSLDALSNVRNMWVQNPETEQRVTSGELVEASTWSLPDRDLAVRQVNFLGMKLFNAGIVTDDAYQTISRFVGQYWFGKGTASFMEFINYCLSSDLVVVNMWTENYVDFLPEGDPAIGTPIWEGGTWYPTTHVTIEARGGLKGLDIFTLQSFFYEIANYNLVLLAIDATFDMPVVDSTSNVEARVVAMALVGVNNVVLSNFQDVTAPAPGTVTLGNAKPTTHYAMGASVDFPNAVMLGGPVNWAYADAARTMKVPVYASQTAVPGPAIGLTLVGSTSAQYSTLVGNITWTSLAADPSIQVPTFSTDAYSIEDTGQVETQIVGDRSTLLTNPAGFYEIRPGRFAPYWL